MAVNRYMNPELPLRAQQEMPVIAGLGERDCGRRPTWAYLALFALTFLAGAVGQ